MRVFGIGVHEETFLRDEFDRELEEGFEWPISSVADVDDTLDSGTYVGMGGPFAVGVVYGTTRFVVVVFGTCTVVVVGACTVVVVVGRIIEGVIEITTFLLVIVVVVIFIDIIPTFITLAPLVVA